MLTISKHPNNPIITPGIFPWRAATVYNPGAIYHDNKVYLFERAAASLRPHQCWIGLLSSDDGIHFKHVVDKPVFTPEMMGWKHGSVQDPRITKIDDTFYMVYAVRQYAVHFGQPSTFKMTDYYPDFSGKEEDNWSRSAIASSTDLINWKNLGFCTLERSDDRDNMLFPEKINGKFAMLRRPQWGKFSEGPSSIKISCSDDLSVWTDPITVMSQQSSIRWEKGKIGASTPPIRTAHGWLLLYHAVGKDYIYRVGAMLLDIQDPTRVLAKTKVPLLEPIESYEKIGPFIGNVVFPCGAVVINNILHIYYGCSDYVISLATVPLDDLLEFLILSGQ